jgi:hypothetical protein
MGGAGPPARRRVTSSSAWRAFAFLEAHPTQGAKRGRVLVVPLAGVALMFALDRVALVPALARVVSAPALGLPSFNAIAPEVALGREGVVLPAAHGEIAGVIGST